MLTPEVIEAREKLIDESLDLYFTPEGIPKETRAVDPTDGRCLFKLPISQDEMKLLGLPTPYKHCALGRLVSDKNMDEDDVLIKFSTVDERSTITPNGYKILEVLKDIGCHSGDNFETLRFANDIQCYTHDETDLLGVDTEYYSHEYRKTQITKNWSKENAN